MNGLPDGDYEVIVIDAIDSDAGPSIDLTITSGARKGDVVRVRMSRATSDAVALLGLPATLFVRDGEPRVTFD